MSAEYSLTGGVRNLETLSFRFLTRWKRRKTLMTDWHGSYINMLNVVRLFGDKIIL